MCDITGIIFFLFFSYQGSIIHCIVIYSSTPLSFFLPLGVPLLFSFIMMPEETHVETAF